MVPVHLNPYLHHRLCNNSSYSRGILDEATSSNFNLTTRQISHVREVVHPQIQTQQRVDSINNRCRVLNSPIEMLEELVATNVASKVSTNSSSNYLRHKPRQLVNKVAQDNNRLQTPQYQRVAVEELQRSLVAIHNKSKHCKAPRHLSLRPHLNRRRQRPCRVSR